MRKFISANLEEISALAGSSALVFGVSMLSVPAAWIVAGVLLIGLAVIHGKANAVH